MASSDRTKLRVIFVLVVLSGNMMLFAKGATAQGTLGRIRKQVRSNEAPPKATQTNTPPADDEADSQAGSKLNAVISSVRKNKPARPAVPPSANRNRSRRRTRGRGGFAVCPPAFHQPHYVEHIHIYDASPAPWAEPRVVVEPSPPPVVIKRQAPAAEDMVVDESYLETYVDSFQSWAIRAEAFYGGNFDELSVGGFGLLIQAPGALGLDIGVTTFRESGFAFRDHLWLGDVNAVFETGMDDFRARIGLGINWLSDPFGSDAGFNLTAGFDHQLSENWIAAGEVDFGTIGDTDLFHGQLSVGRRFGNAELIFGYDYYNIGGTGIDGWFTGMRFRF